MRGNLWQISSAGVIIAFTALVLDFDTSATGVTGDIVGVLSAISPVMALTFFIAIMALVAVYVFGDVATGGGF